MPRRTERERFTAFHEAGHAVVMHVLGYGVGKVTIQPQGATLGSAEPGRSLNDIAEDAIDARDQLERYCMVLHAGSAAEKILDASTTVTGYGSEDHNRIHEAIGYEEDDPGVREAWCAYLWQRSYALLLTKWGMVQSFANALLTFTTVSRDDSMTLLGLFVDGPIVPPYATGLAARDVCPWHRDESYYQAMVRPRTYLTAGGEASFDDAPSPRLLDVLKNLSGRARNALVNGNIVTVQDLTDWNERSLRCLKQVGRWTSREIVDAAREAGLTMAPDGADLPWKRNPKRWS